MPNFSSDTLRLCEMREMGAMDYASGIDHARNEGGYEKAVEIAERLLRRNTPIVYVVEDTGLDEEFVIKLQSEINV